MGNTLRRTDSDVSVIFFNARHRGINIRNFLIISDKINSISENVRNCIFISDKFYKKIINLQNDISSYYHNYIQQRNQNEIRGFCVKTSLLKDYLKKLDKLSESLTTNEYLERCGF
jgi:hypothetical protein